MKTLKQTAPNRLEIRSGGGLVSFFGLPFVAAGVFLVLIGTGVVVPQNADEVPGWANPLVALMGLVFASVGGWLFLGRTWITIDKTRGTITRQRGLIVPMRLKKRLLYEFDTVVLGFVSGDSDSSDRFPVTLRSVTGGKEYPLCDTTDYATSRANAEQIANLVGKPLKDATTDHATVLDLGEISDSFRKRTRRDDVPFAARPLTMRSTVQETAEGVTITIPGPRHHPAMLLFLVFPGGVFWWVYTEVVPLFEKSNTPDSVQWIGLAFVGLFMLLPTAGMVMSVLRPKRIGTLIRASVERITVEERNGRKKKTTVIPADDILDIDYSTREGTLRAAHERAVAQGYARTRQPGSMQAIPSWVKWVSGAIPSKGITVKSRSGFHVFAAGLPDAEVEYLHSVLEKALVGS